MPRKRKTKKKKTKRSLDPLEAIKRLLVLQLLINKASLENIAEILDVDSSTIRHMISIRRIKKLQKH